MVQPLEAGVVRAIHVRDGQFVRAGDLLIELDPTAPEADAERLALEHTSALLQLARGQALLSALEGRGEPTLAVPSTVDAARRSEAQRLLSGQYAEYQTRRERVSADIARREAELLLCRLARVLA